MLYQQRGLDMESPQETRLDFTRVPHWFGIPRYMFRTAAVSAWRALVLRLQGDATSAFDQELYVWMFVGILKQRWTDRHKPMAWQTAAAATY
jgi:hypothetical protein